ncbi:DUF4837 family protein [Flavobacterium sp.]|uniref:DUF4837 family protein n=1 Tax=Flavobacterium sp. TaxID=239 RepID=UPI00286EEA6F|nr:DUF4837 family protein [Flavobacterium sp.]
MNKTHFLCLLFSVVLFSCFKKESDMPRKTTGKINTIAVVIDDQLWNGEIGDSIRNKFASPVIGLPEEEPLFTINQYPVKLLEGFATDSRAIIVIKKEDENKFEIQKNQYATPQNVFHISGKTAEEVLEQLEQHTPEIIQLIEQGEIAESQRINKQSLLNTKAIGKQFKIGIQVPSNFEYVLRKPNFVWLKKKIISGSSSLLVYQVPLNTIKTQSAIAVTILKMRDSIGKYIQGTEPHTYMISETGYTPYFFKSKIDHRLAYETRGTWQLQNDYMSGPFINYAIVDKLNNRLLVVEGFCYSPSKEKRDEMHELEAIMHSVHILKNNTFTPHKK